MFTDHCDNARCSFLAQEKYQPYISVGIPHRDVWVYEKVVDPLTGRAEHPEIATADSPEEIMKLLQSGSCVSSIIQPSFIWKSGQGASGLKFKFEKILISSTDQSQAVEFDVLP